MSEHKVLRGAGARERSLHYTVHTLRALDATAVTIWADGELVASFWDAELDAAAIQAGNFLGEQVKHLARPGEHEA